MMGTKARRERVRTWLASTLLLGTALATALATAGCVGGTRSTTGGGPASVGSPSEEASPGLSPSELTPATTGTAGAKQSAAGSATAHASDVEADVYQQVVEALKAQGYAMQSASELRMSYGTDKRHVNVSGRMTGPKGGETGAPTSTIGMVRLELRDGAWQVTEAR